MSGFTDMFVAFGKACAHMDTRQEDTMDLNIDDLNYYGGDSDFSAKLKTAVAADLRKMEARIEALEKAQQPEKLKDAARKLRAALREALSTNFEASSNGDRLHQALSQLWDETAWVEEG